MTTLIVIGVYLAAVLSVGIASHRLFRGTGEDYFLATRTIGPFVLLMTLFGTHMTAFSLLGAAGEAYRSGIGTFSLMASSSAIVVPAVIFFVGVRVWSAGKRLGFVTQPQFFRERYESDGLGLLLFVVTTTLVIPYLLIGVKGGGITLNQITGGLVPPWVGGLVISAVVLTYVTYGGMRGTAWANTFQTVVFMVLGAITLGYILIELGGLQAALDRVEQTKPDLMVRGETIPPLKLLTYTFIPLSAGMFPHLFMHWLTARRLSAFRLPIIAYPLCIAIVWIPSVLLGVLGWDRFAGLQGPETSGILIKMIYGNAPELLAGLLGAGVFAAVMSSLDSQSLSLGTMFTRDVLKHYNLGAQTEEAQIRAGRFFIAGILIVTYLLSLVADTTIFSLAVWSFTGFAGLFPILVAAVWWPRSTKAGALTATAVTIMMWLGFFLHGWQTPGYTVGGTGIMPVAVLVLVSSTVVVLVSLFTTPPSQSTLRRFFPEGTAS